MSRIRYIKMLAAVAVFALLVPALASANVSTTFVGFQAEIHTNGEQFAIRNISDTATITEVQLTLGTGALFASDSFSVAGLTVTHFADESLYPSWENAFTTGLTSVGYNSAVLSSDMKTATFSFTNFIASETDFESGESWGVTFGLTDIDGDSVGGADMNYAKIAVTYANPDGILTYLYGTFNGNKQSFPAEVGELRAVPIPGAALLLGPALLGLVALRRRELV
ncbi:hypothetical protein H4684_002629 [Desulfomicrobium macestii]|uniref:PEP-CTERM protein-sorting domain-containing protein n=1 Tax=Desulfomicrobium macestii TaxID=90731 RepID=A0ABR9H5K2_9BACT|nr:hypothetical protein [Desulfomicrobium macestii]MBE1425970.1 hypothetical protein [Desulfomicrobium macestii]